MSREPLAEEGSRWADLADRVREQYQEFREGRLYVQVMLTLVMVFVSGLVALVPVGPLARVHEALTWTVTHDYDFAGQAVAVREWADERGGWQAAAAGVWHASAERVRQWAAPLLPDPAEAPVAQEEPAVGNTVDDEEAEEPATPAAAASWIMPVDGSVMNAFGWHSADGKDRYLNGVDILALRGAPVVAVTDGVVVRVTRHEELGHLVEVEHGDLLVLYAQLEGVRVKVGDRLRQGARIGAVGNPVGESRQLSPHLRLEVRPKASGNPVDPIPYLPLGGKQI